MVEEKKEVQKNKEESEETTNMLPNIAATLITFLAEKKGLGLSDINIVLDIGKTIVMDDLLSSEDLNVGDELDEPGEPEPGEL